MTIKTLQKLVYLWPAIYKQKLVKVVIRIQPFISFVQHLYVPRYTHSHVIVSCFLQFVVCILPFVFAPLQKIQLERTANDREERMPYKSLYQSVSISVNRFALNLNQLLFSMIKSILLKKKNKTERNNYAISKYLYFHQKAELCDNYK